MKRILVLLIALLLLASGVSCGEYKPPIDSPGTDVGGDQEQPTEPPNDGEEQPFTVSLTYNGQPYIPAEPINAQWTDEYSFYHAAFDETGVAKTTGLDGDYQVTLSGLPEGYTYNPNIYFATNDKRTVTIELYKVAAMRGTGKDLYQNIISLSETDVYRAELTDADHVIYYQFIPRHSGTYSIESWVDTTQMQLNPKLDVYFGSVAYKTFGYELDDGGASNGFTKNFKYEVEIDESQIGSVFAFGVKVVARGNAYPARVDFAIKLNGSFSMDTINSDMVVPQQLYDTMVRELAALQKLPYETLLSMSSLRKYSEQPNWEEGYYEALLQAQYATLMTMDFARDPNKDEADETKRLNALFAEFWTVYARREEMEDVSIFRNYLSNLYNNDGRFVGAETLSSGRYIFDGTQYALNPKTGFYHLYNAERFTWNSTNASDRAYAQKYGEGYGPILYANISSPCRFLELAFIDIEYQGNKALTVSNGTENYKHFLEGWSRMVAGAAGQPGYYCGTDCTGCHKNEDGSTMGACTQNDMACLAGCTTCTTNCRACDEALMYAPGYNELTNSDGNFPVTPELKDFLQKYSVSQLLFFDGNGWVEENPNVKVDSMEDDQWLFACGYYIE